jgi:AraC-like DNA-binding protein
MKLMPFISNQEINEPPALTPLPEAREHAFAFTRYVEPRFHFRWHYHREVELVWIRSGKGLRYLGRSVEPFGKGDLVLVGPNLPHSWGSAADQCGNADWSVIQFLPERWGNSFWQMAEAEDLLKLIKRAECGIQFCGKDARKIGDLIESVAEVPAYSFEALSIFVEICRRLLGAEHRLVNASSIGSSASCPDQRFQKVLSLIDTLSCDRLSQAQMAEELNMSAATFSRWFKQRMGRTFQRYVNEVRVSRVCAHLAKKDENITTVALDSGYNNLANFNRRFREIMGITPKAFRSQTRLLKMDPLNPLLPVLSQFETSPR